MIWVRLRLGVLLLLVVAFLLPVQGAGAARGAWDVPEHGYDNGTTATTGAATARQDVHPAGSATPPVLSPFEASRSSTPAARAGGALTDDVARTFKGGQYATRTLDEDLVLYRRWGGEAGELGPYWSRTNYSRTGNARRYSALPPGNTAENLATIRVPAGTTIHEGRAAAHTAWGAPGGGSQVVFDEGFRVPRSWVQP